MSQLKLRLESQMLPIQPHKASVNLPERRRVNTKTETVQEIFKKTEEENVLQRND